MDTLILEWQKSLPSFGVPYSGPKDGNMNTQFTEAMITLEAKHQLYGQLLTSSGVRMSVNDAKQLLDKKSVVIPQQDNLAEQWVNFFSQSLPVVGKVYHGSLKEAGKKIESVIEESIHHPMTGIIWNEKTQQFNTTPDDIKRALELIQQHKQSPSASAKLTLDQRVTKMSQILLEKK